VKPATIAKLALAVSGIAVFGIGIRFDNIVMRWTGVALVGVAFLLRFIKDPPTGEQ
jgi:hypothetical protein